MPSTGTFSPGRTRTRSPTATWSRPATSCLSAVAEDAGGGGGQADECLDGGGGALLGLELQPAAHQDEGDHDERGLEVEVERQAPGLGLGGPEGDEGAVAVGDPGTEGDQGVHGGGPVLGRRPRLAVDVGAGPQLDAVAMTRMSGISQSMVSM